MIKEFYHFNTAPDRLHYRFYSKGPKGTIEKIVVFEHEGNDNYNIGFGDVIDGKIITTVISNNQDLLKVISTIVFIIHIFYQNFPTAILEIVAVDIKRLRLYNTIFKRRYAEIELDFFIDGYRNNKYESYSPDFHYEKFQIRLKDF